MPTPRGTPSPARGPLSPARRRQQSAVRRSPTPCDGLGPLLRYRRAAAGLEEGFCRKFDEGCAPNDWLHLVYYTAQAFAALARLYDIATAAELAILGGAWLSIAAMTAALRLGALPLRRRQPLYAGFRLTMTVLYVWIILPRYMHLMQPLDTPAAPSPRCVLQELYLPVLLCIAAAGLRLPLKVNFFVLTAQLAMGQSLLGARCAAELARPGRAAYYRAVLEKAARLGRLAPAAAAAAPAAGALPPLADAQACRVVKVASLVVLGWLLPLGAFAAAEERWRLKYAADARRNTPILPSGARLLLSNLALVALAAPVVLRALLLWHGWR